MFTKGKKITKEIGLRLQEVRRNAGLSASEMADRLEISKGGYAKNEGGLSIPCIDSLRHLTLDFDISMDWFLFDKGPRYYKEKSERERELEKTLEELRNESAKLEREVEELKNRLEEEHKNQAKIAQEKAGAFDMIPEVKELLDHMKQDPVFYHRSLLNFQEFKQQKKIPAETGEEPL